MTKVLFAGTFLSNKTGSFGVTESLVEKLRPLAFMQCKLVSKYQNKILRILEISFASSFYSYEILHVDVFSGPAFLISEITTILARIRHKRIILTFHGGKLPEYFCSKHKRINRLKERAWHLQTPSLYLKEFFKKQGIELQYLPNSINLNLFQFDRSEIKTNSILWVRAFTEIYNPHLAIDILLEVHKTIPDASLTMVGPDKGLLDSTIDKIRKSKLEKFVRIVGPVRNEDLSNYYHSHHVYLNTTRYESFGMAVLEAAACGIPVVSSKVGEIPYLYSHERDILMVEDFDPSKFAVEIIRVIKTPDLAAEISSNARKLAEGFDWDRIKEQWIDILSS
jgi:glycosyltransferase involved in cell wall biosynthesis